MQLLGHTGLRQLLARHRFSGFDPSFLAEDDVEACESWGRTRAKRAKSKRFPPVPSEEGRRLMDGGDFGRSQSYKDTMRKRKPSLARNLMNRETGLDAQNSSLPASRIAQVSD